MACGNEKLRFRLQGPIGACRSRRLAFAAARALVLPPLQGASTKIDYKEPRYGDDQEPQDSDQELPDLRPQNLPLRHANAPYVRSIVHNSRLCRNEFTPVCQG